MTPEDKATKAKFNSWCILELMGHVRLAGFVTEAEMFGGVLGRIDVPKTETCPLCCGTPLIPIIEGACPCKECKDGKVEKTYTQFFGNSSVYRLTPVSEEVARHVANTVQAAPVSAWDFPKALTHQSEDDADERSF